jgi:ethanolamine-phosphate cytidylyltransferase
MPGINALSSAGDGSPQPVQNGQPMTNGTPGTTRVWVDGCFDMVHLGHANNLRQSKNLGDYLIVGIHSDEEITHHKGPPVFTEDERYTMVKGIKWVDEVIRSVPYVTTVATLDQYKCDFCAHGNDITTTIDGSDTYQEVKDAGRYREVERTQGVSTTALVKRMLALTGQLNINEQSASSPYTGEQFLPTVKKIKEFSGQVEIPANAKVVYVDGAFDVLHPGHLAFLEKAAQMGDYVLVGVHDDETVAAYKGSGHPIMNIHERYFSVLGCKYATDVVIGAPYVVTEELLDHFNVSLVLHGETPIPADPDTSLDPYAEAKRRGIYQQIDSGSKMTTEDVIARIEARRPEYEERNRKKEIKEAAIVKAMKMMMTDHQEIHPAKAQD